MGWCLWQYGYMTQFIITANVTLFLIFQIVYLKSKSELKPGVFRALFSLVLSVVSTTSHIVH